MTSFQCTEDPSYPIIDVVLAPIGLVGIVAPEGGEESYERGLGAAWFLAFGSSAYEGFYRVSACRAAKEELAHRSGELARLRMMAREP